MSVFSKNTVAPVKTLTTADVAAFRDQVSIGDVISAVIHVREWVSGTNFNWVPQLATVTVKNKYPHLVETDCGIFTWNDFAYGFHKLVCTAAEMEEKAKQAAAQNEKTAA